jgi:hypothetical protein
MSTGWMDPRKNRKCERRVKDEKVFFGWLDQKTGKYHLSQYPADCPVRPSTEFETRGELEALVLRKRGRVCWWPPLPSAAEILSA